MKQYKFIAEIMSKYWFQKVTEKDGKVWIFDSEIESMTTEQLKDVIHLYLQCIDKGLSDEHIGKAAKFIDKVRYFIYDGITINRDILSRFLFAITLAEYRVNGILYHPPEMRLREFDEIANAIGFDSDTVRKIDDNWHSKIRKKVLNDFT